MLKLVRFKKVLNSLFSTQIATKFSMPECDFKPDKYNVRKLNL